MTGNRFLLSYRWRPGMLAWILHRLAGLGLIFYLALHIFVTRAFHEAAKIPDSIRRADEFSRIYGILSHPLFGLLEIALLGAVLYHALNGLRVLIIDFGGGARYQKKLWFALMGVFLLLMAVFGGLMAAHVLHRMGGAA